ncbi:MAG: CRISPR-associated endonuclease Cas2 [Blastocatellia bacterium]
MFIVLAYDVPDDRRRARLFKTLKRFGEPVQESVFEFHLNQSEMAHLKRAVLSVIDERVDDVRYYYLCPTCQQRTEMTYPGRRTDNPFAVIA